MKAFASHFGYELSLGVRNRTLLIMNYLMPLGFFALMGVMMADINPDYGLQMVPAMVVFAALTSTIMGLPGPMVEAKEGEILRSYRINGVPVGSLLAIPAISTALHITLAAAIVTATAPLFFDAPLPTEWPAFFLVFFVFLFAVSGVGTLIGVIAANSRVTVLWQQLAYLPSMMLGGLMMPGDILPEVLVRVGHLLPASWAMQSFLGLAYGRETLYEPLWGVGVLLVGGIAAYALAAWLFAWDSKNSGRRGHPALALLALLPYLLGALILV